ncbi:hypothetical protein [Streptomyces sp. NPDC005283]|uniref:hypothetical protein n=1 Tax=Streptomyces sp. NPDC005283 TaxID=3156871 RepID=UPI003456A34C
MSEHAAYEGSPPGMLGGASGYGISHDPPSTHDIARHAYPPPASPEGYFQATPSAPPADAWNHEFYPPAYMPAPSSGVFDAPELNSAGSTGPDSPRPATPARHGRLIPASTPAHPEELSPAEAERIIEKSSLGDSSVLEIGRRTTERDVSEVMRRLKTKKEPKAEPLPEHSFEKWVRDSKESPDLLMKVGRSYAQQGYHHRAELCFAQALEAGNADAQSALQYLPRDEYGVLLPGNTTAEYTPPPSATETAHIPPLGEETVNLMEEGLRLAKSGNPARARLIWSIGCVLDGGAWSPKLVL